MNIIKGLIIGVVIVIILAIITFFTFNKNFMNTNKQLSPAVSSQATKSVAKTPVDTNNIASPADKNLPLNSANIDSINTGTDNNTTNKNITNNNNKTITNHDEINTINSNTSYKNNIISNKNTSLTSKPINNTSKNNNKDDNNNTSNHNIIDNNTNSKNNTNKQNLQMYYLNQLTSISEKINGISTNNDNDAQLLSNAGMQCNSWNSEMNVINTKLSEVLPKSQYDTLAKAQYNWMNQRNGTVQVLSNAGGSISPILAAQKEAQLTKDRCYYLVNNYMPS